jgi:NhaP-type Na+/H+ or K+/H+ antiporter
MRIIYWTIALAIVGGVLATKSAIIHVEEVFIGSFLGALLGLAIGWSINKINKKPRVGSND